MEAELLVFSKLMRRTDVNHRLLVPTAAYRRHFPIFHGNVRHIRVRYGFESQIWRLPCYVRRGASVYDKPIISGSWRHIAAAKRFAVGDILRFYKEQDHEGPVYRFMVFRKVVDEAGQGNLVFIP